VVGGERVSEYLGESKKKGSGKYPERKIKLYHNNKFRNLGEPFKY